MLIIDGTFLIYKSYYRTKKLNDQNEMKSISHFKKVARNMFLKMVSQLKNQYADDAIFIVFDCEGTNFRHNLLPTYKSSRKEKPKELKPIKYEVYDFLTKCNFPFQVSNNAEGDDLIASYIHQNPEEICRIYSGDMDMAALINKNVTFLFAKNQQKIREITIENAHHFLPCPPSRMYEFKSLQGDKSDFIKGIDGLFHTEVLHLFMEYPSIEEFFQNGQNHHLYHKISSEKKKIMLNRQLVSMKKDCAISVSKERCLIKDIRLPPKIAEKIKW